MKKCRLFTTLLCSSFLLAAGVAAVNGVSTRSVVEASAYGYNAADEKVEKDLTGIYHWKAKDGNFVRVPNFANSGFGFSYDFKCNTATFNVMRIALTSGDEEVTSYFYTMRSNYGHEKSEDRGRFIALGDGWYRYQLMFHELKTGGVNATDHTNVVLSGKENATVDGMKMTLNWGDAYKNDLTIKNMHVIRGYDVFIDDFASKGNISTWDNNDLMNVNLPNLNNFLDGKVGFYFEYKPARPADRIAIMFTFMTADPKTSEYGKYKFFLNSTVSDLCGAGREYRMSDGWNRYELMPADLKALGFTSSSRLIRVDFSNGAGYVSKLGNRGHLAAYTNKVTYVVDGQVSDNVFASGIVPSTLSTLPKDKCVTTWYTDAKMTTPYDFSQKLTGDVTLYGKSTTHNFIQRVTSDYALKTPATCSTRAEYYYSCACGECSRGIDENMTFVAGTSLGHTFDKEVVDAMYLKSEATCTAKAVYYKSCECGLSAEFYAPEATFEHGEFAPHDYCLEVADPMYLKTPATCCSEAVYFRSCACGASSEETEFESTFTFGGFDLSAHVAGDPVIEVVHGAACAEEGTHFEVTYCDVCGATLDVKVVVDSPLGHTYEAKGGVVSSDKTTGVIKLVCTTDPLHVVNVSAKVTNTSVSEDGKTTTYTLSGTFEGKTYTTTVTVEAPKSAGGCGGSIIAASSIIAIASILGIGFLSIKKKHE